MKKHQFEEIGFYLSALVAIVAYGFGLTWLCILFGVNAVTCFYDVWLLAKKSVVKKRLKRDTLKPAGGGDCGMNYCDENGCIDRKRNYVEGMEPGPCIAVSTPTRVITERDGST